MASCFICGTEKSLKSREDLFKCICVNCSKTTPRKVSRAAFDKRYWGQSVEASKVPESTKREFYSDYLSSTNTLESYIKATTTQTE